MNTNPDSILFANDAYRGVNAVNYLIPGHIDPESGDVAYLETEDSCLLLKVKDMDKLIKSIDKLTAALLTRNG